MLLARPFVLLGLFFVLSGFSGNRRTTASLIGNVVVDFKLRNVDNTQVALADFNAAKGFIVVFTCNHCPFAKLYPSRLNELNTKYQALGIPLLAINPMDSVMYEEESFALMQEKAKEQHYTFPYLSDTAQSVGKNFGALHTPHAFVIWKENNRWVIKYSGAIDDNGEHPEIATSFISLAVEALLQHKPVPISETQSFGCKIIYR